MTTIAFAGAVLILPVVGCLIILDRFRRERLLNTNYTTLSLHSLTITAIGLAALGIMSQLAFISTGVTTTLEKYPYAIYQHLLSNLTPLVMAGLVFCIPLKVLLNQIMGRTK